MKARLPDATGYRLPGFTKRDAVPLTGAHFASLPTGDVMIRIHLENAEVFALTIE